MVCQSICTSLLCSRTPIFNPKCQKLGFSFERKVTSSSSFHLSQLQKTLSSSSSQKSSNPQLGRLNSVTNYPISPLHEAPHLNISRVCYLFSEFNPPSSILKLPASKLAVMMIWSLIFLGSLNPRPVVALPTTQKSTSSATMEERRDTQNDQNDNEDMYLKILEKNPRDVEVLKAILYAKMRKRKTKEAVEYVEKLIDIQPNEIEWRLLQALTYEMMGNLNRAKTLFKQILKERPLLLRALHGLAMVMHKNREGPAVFDMLEKALKLAQHEKRVTEERNIRILIAQMHVVKGNLEEGLKEFQDLVNENPRDFRPYLCQGIIYSLQGKKEEAQEQFETYRCLVPEEFPQRGFLDDVVLAAKTESQEQLEKDFEVEFSYRK